MLKDLLPMDLIRTRTPDEWKQIITNWYKKQGPYSKEDAKIKFLEVIYQWPTFGSAFFEVKVCFYYSQLKHRLSQAKPSPSI